MASGLVGKRNLQPRGFTTGNTSCTYRLKYPVAVAATNLKLVFPAWTTQAAGTGDTATGNPVTLGAVYVEYGGSLFPVTFAGASSVAITSGSSVTSDAVAGLSVTAGSTLYVRTYVTVTSGGQWPTLYGAVAYPDEVSRPGANLANATGDLTGTGQSIAGIYGPDQIYGDVTSPLYALSVLGDSIVAGVNDSFSDESQVGYWQRALYPGSRPYSIVALPGESASQFLTQAGNRAALVGDYATYFVNEYGINDLQGGATLAQLQARVRSIAQTTSSDATLVKRFQQTLGPKSSSTDGWATTGSQTTDGLNTTRVAFNDWVRAGMPESGGVAVAVGTSGALLAGQAGHPYSGYLEVADLCETVRNSGIWKAGYTTDGLHPGPTGNAAIASALDLSPFVDTASSSGGGGASGLAVSTTSPAIISSAFQGSGASQAYASRTFSPPAGSLIVVEAHATESFNNAWNNPTITDSLATHLTWNRLATQQNTSFSGVVSTVSVFWAWCPSAQTNMTVTVTQSLAGSGQTITFSSVVPRVWTGADTVPAAPVALLAQGAVTAQALAVAVTPAGSGSALCLAANNAAAASAATAAGSGEYVAGETHTGTSFVSAWFGNSVGPTIPATAQTLDLTGNTAARWEYIAYEVKGASAAAVPATTAGRSSAGSSQGRAGAASGAAVLSGSSSAGSGRAGSGSVSAGALAVGTAACSSSSAAAGLASAGAAQVAQASVGSSQATTGAPTAAALTVGSPASSSSQAVPGATSTGQAATVSGSPATSTSTARAGTSTGAATSTGTPATSSSQAQPGVATAAASIPALVVGSPASSSSTATAGAPSAGALFAGGAATSTSRTIAGAYTAVAVAVGRAASSSSRATTGRVNVAPTSPPIRQPRLHVVPNPARLHVPGNHATLTIDQD